MRAPLVALLSVAACKREPETVYLSDYDLALEVVSAPNDPLPEGLTWTASLRDRESPPTYVGLEGDPPAAGELAARDQVWVGLLASTAGIGPGGWEAEGLRAWGEIGPLSLDDDALTAPVLVSTVGGLGALGELPEAETRYHAAAAVTDGAVRLFGGTPLIANGGTAWAGEALESVLLLRELDAGTWEFEVEGSMPSVMGIDGRVGASASPLPDGLILVAGGRPSFALKTGSGATKHAFLWDPVAGSPTAWRGELALARSGHLAVPLKSGVVALVGGAHANDLWPARASIEIFDPETLTFRAGSFDLDVPATGFAAASVPDGAGTLLICGGSRLVTDGLSRFQPSDACNRLYPTNDVEGPTVAAHAKGDTPTLPVPLQMHAMAGLPGGALVCGGLDDDAGAVALTDSAQATARAWRLDLDGGWREVSPMRSRRAGHTAVALPDGRIAIFGGASRTGPYLAGGASAAVACPEIFDPSTEIFTASEVCDANGGGAGASTAWHPEHGGFVLGGLGAASPGRGYSLLGLGPPFP